jgi:hypothetical protein
MIPGIPLFGIAYALKRGGRKFVAATRAYDVRVSDVRMPECFDVIEIELISRSGFAGCVGLFTALGSKSTRYAT